jgi:DNA-binding response OmpR family regulator
VSKQSLLLVDGDTRSLRVLEVSLRKAGFMVTAALSVQDALDKLELHAPDLIISETAFPDGDGFELRRRVRAAPEWSEIPFIFLTAEAAIENKIRGLELGVDDYLTKPIYIKEIVTRINILLQKRQRTRFEERRDGRTRFAGRVQDMPVVDVIQTIEISRKSGVIQFVGERGRQAAIYFRDGRVIDAEAGSLQGEDAVYRLLTWSEGEFEVVFRTVRRREVITMSSQALLMEGMRRLDEWSRLFEQLPSLTHRFEVDTIELAARLGDVPDDNNRILRLVDGKRALLEVIDASDLGDLECLQAISRLYFEELLIDLDHGQDVEHGKAGRRDTGKYVALVEVDGPVPVGDENSGPVARGAAEGSASDAPNPPRGAARDGEEVADAIAALASGAAAGAEAAEADDHDVGPLMGGYRPSSLRLIDEAVAAAQAIEPSLFDDSRSDEPLPAPGHVGNGVSRTTTDRLSNGHAAPESHEVDVAAALAADDSLRLAEREDSGLRMIGSLGRDRAEASGELAAFGQSRPLRSETARELVTILPRRITRELPIVPQELADSLPTPTPTASVLVSRPMPLEEMLSPYAEPTHRVVLPGSGVRAASRSRKLLRLVRPVGGGGPGIVAVLLIALALVLAGTAGLLRLRRHTVTPPAPSGHSEHGAPASALVGDRAGSPGASDGAAAGTAGDHAVEGASVVVEPSSSGQRLSAVADLGARGGDPANAGTEGEAAARPGAPAAAGSEPGATAGAVAGAGDGASDANKAGPAAGGAASADASEASNGGMPVGAGAGAGDGASDAGKTSPAGARGGAKAGGADASKAAAPGPGANAGASASVATGTSTGNANGAVAGTGKTGAGDRVAEAKVLCDQASSAIDEGDFAHALQLAAASIKLRRTAKAFMLRARAEQRLGRVDDALSSLDAATELAPGYGAIWEQRGRILWAARRRDEARAAFSRFLELAPKSTSAPEILRLINEPR